MGRTQKQRRLRHHRSKKYQLSRYLMHWFVPHRHNNFQPHFINRYSIASLLLLFIFTQVFGSWTQHSSVLGQQAPMTSTQLLTSTNDERAKAGVDPLQLNTQLVKAASLKAKDMLDNNYWAHTSPKGVTPWHWLQEAGYSYAYAGENLARNFPSAQATVAAWMQSPGHRENLLHAHYTEVGFAIADGKIDGQPVRLVVALYATPASSLTLAVAGSRTNAPGPVQVGIMARIGMSIQSMNPMTLGILFLVVIGLLVALITAMVATTGKYQIKETQLWRRHHGTIKLIGMSVFAALIIVAQQIGQIG